MKPITILPITLQYDYVFFIYVFCLCKAQEGNGDAGEPRSQKPPTNPPGKSAKHVNHHGFHARYVSVLSVYIYLKNISLKSKHICRPITKYNKVGCLCLRRTTMLLIDLSLFVPLTIYIKNVKVEAHRYDFSLKIFACRS